VIDDEPFRDGKPTLYDLLSDAAAGGAPGRTETTRTIETSDESASPIEPIVSS
jgi:hypothetical protein